MLVISSQEKMISTKLRLGAIGTFVAHSLFWQGAVNGSSFRRQRKLFNE
jgi:hypothetical protein